MAQPQPLLLEATSQATRRSSLKVVLCRRGWSWPEQLDMITRRHRARPLHGRLQLTRYCMSTAHIGQVSLQRRGLLSCALNAGGNNQHLTANSKQPTGLNAHVSYHVLSNISRFRRPRLMHSSHDTMVSNEIPTILDLELIRDQTSTEQGAEIMKIFDSAMNPATQESAAEAAPQLDELCSPLEHEQEARDYCWHLWTLMIDVARSPDVSDKRGPGAPHPHHHVLRTACQGRVERPGGSYPCARFSTFHYYVLTANLQVDTNCVDGPAHVPTLHGGALRRYAPLCPRCCSNFRGTDAILTTCMRLFLRPNWGARWGTVRPPVGSNMAKQ
jgi:hypothetical protein